MKLSLFFALLSLTLILSAVFLVSIDTLIGKVLLAQGAAFLPTAGFRFIEARKDSAKDGDPARPS